MQFHDLSQIHAYLYNLHLCQGKHSFVFLKTFLLLFPLHSVPSSHGPQENTLLSTEINFVFSTITYKSNFVGNVLSCFFFNPQHIVFEVHLYGLPVPVIHSSLLVSNMCDCSLFIHLFTVANWGHF